MLENKLEHNNDAEGCYFFHTTNRNQNNEDKLVLTSRTITISDSTNIRGSKSDTQMTERYSTPSDVYKMSVSEGKGQRNKIDLNSHFQHSYTLREFNTMDTKDGDIIIKPKIEKYNQAQKILETHQEKLNKISLNSCIFNHLNTSSSPRKVQKETQQGNISPIYIETISTSQTKQSKAFMTIDVHDNIAPATTRSSLHIKSNKDQLECEEQKTSSLRLNFLHNNKEPNYNNGFVQAGSNINNFSNHNQPHRMYDMLSGNYESKYLDDKELKSFLTAPLENGIWMKCKIERIIQDKKLTKFYLSLNENDKSLLSCVKKAKKSYMMYMLKDALNGVEDIESYLGKVKSNFFGTEFNTFNNGKKPKKEKNIELHRANITTITYETNLLGLKGPRKMKVYIPKVNPNDHAGNKLNPTSESLKKRYSSHKGNSDAGKVTLLMNKQPVWSDKRKCYVLDYNERIIKQSVKNFQLVQSSHHNSDVALNDEILLQFGRTGENSFILDFQFPFSPIQAFSIALSSIDNKIACE